MNLGLAMLLEPAGGIGDVKASDGRVFSGEGDGDGDDALTEFHRFRQYRQGGDAGFREQKEKPSSSPSAY